MLRCSMLADGSVLLGAGLACDGIDHEDNDDDADKDAEGDENARPGRDERAVASEDRSCAYIPCVADGAAVALAAEDGVGLSGAKGLCASVDRVGGDWRAALLFPARIRLLPLFAAVGRTLGDAAILVAGHVAAELAAPVSSVLAVVVRRALGELDLKASCALAVFVADGCRIAGVVCVALSVDAQRKACNAGALVANHSLGAAHAARSASRGDSLLARVRGLSCDLCADEPCRARIAAGAPVHPVHAVLCRRDTRRVLGKPSALAFDARHAVNAVRVVQATVAEVSQLDALSVPARVHASPVEVDQAVRVLGAVSVLLVQYIIIIFIIIILFILFK